MVTRLTLINKSQATPVIAITLADGSGRAVVAWQLVQKMGSGSVHPFSYSSDITINMGDEDGNFTPQLPAPPYSVFAARRTDMGNQLQREKQDSSRAEITVRNYIPDPVTLYLYNSQRVCMQTFLPPQSQTVFNISPTLFIGEAHIEQETPMSKLITFTSEPALLHISGITTADIVMTGGADGEPPVFSLENIRR